MDPDKAQEIRDALRRIQSIEKKVEDALDKLETKIEQLGDVDKIVQRLERLQKKDSQS